MFPFKPIWKPGDSEFKAGDIVAYAGRCWLSAAINVCTYGIPLWSPSHVGILGHAPDGRLLVFESTTADRGPCEITHEPVHGVQAHPLEYMQKIYEGRMWVYPLYRDLYLFEDVRLTEFLVSMIGRGYDAIGALRSAGVGLSWIESLFRDSDLHFVFCSELVAAAYATTGLHASENVSRWNPARLVRHLRWWHRLLCRPQRVK